MPQVLLAVEPVPAPIPLITVLHALTLALHWGAMNVVLVCAWNLATAKAGDHRFLRQMSGTIPPALSLTVTLGVAPLLFLQLIHGERFYASSIHMAWPWLASLLVLMIGYYAAYASDSRLEQGRTPPRWMRVLPLLGLLVFSFVITANVSLSESPQVMKALGGSSGWSLALLETHALSRYLHQIVGAVGIGAVFLTWLGHRARSRGAPEGDALSKRAALTALVATGLAVLLGGWQLMQAPKEIGGALPGASLTMGILAGLGTTGAIVWAWKKPGAKPVVLALVLAFVTIAAKVVLRLAIRAKRLEDAGGVAELETATQVGPIVLFGVCFVLALLVTGWLAKVMLSARPLDEVASASDAASVRGED